MLNKAILQGRLTDEPEIKKTSSGKSVCSFSLAVRRNFGNATDFIDCVVWASKADLLGRFCHKGDMIVVCGTLQKRSYEDRNGGKRNVTEVNVDELFFGKSQRQDDENQPFGIDEPLPF